LPGELFRCPEQAATLQLIAETGGESFYRGRLAEMMVATSAAAGGALSLADLAEHSCDWVTPISIDFHGYRVHELPPNGQGLTALIALGMLDRLELDGLDPDGDAIQHLQIEATKLAMTDGAAHVGDVGAMRLSAAELLAPDYLDKRARLIDPDRAMVPVPGEPRGHDTVYLAAADASGMMVSYIQSNYRGFGSGVVVPGTGIALHNRGSGFVLTPGHPNQVGPRKRPFHTIIPAFATKDGAPVAAIGVMGGSMQPQGHVQLAMRMFAHGQNPQAAVDAPRWRIDGEKVLLDAAWPDGFRAGLAQRGHRLDGTSPLELGGAQVVWRHGDHGWIAASESRRDGQAVGF
jgi:gamma-glutamyltranspeptidase/glutathione hydrolase